MDGSSIKKVTEVTFKDKKYIIEDIYSLNLLPNGTQFEASQAKESATNDSDNKNDVKQKDEDEHKKVYIFKKDKKRQYSQEKKPFPQIRSTKNIAKNFCKAFLVFLKPDRAAEGSRDEGLRIFTQLIKRQRFNNKMIKAVLKN